jgi:hypothetical protein
MTGQQIGFVGCVHEGEYFCAAFSQETVVEFRTFYRLEVEKNQNLGDRLNLKLNSEVDIYLHLAVVTEEKFTLAYPRRGRKFYIDLFKESCYHPGRLNKETSPDHFASD